MNETVISVRGLSKVYRLYREPHHRLLDVMGLLRGGQALTFQALHDLDLEVKRGERIAIIGRNGAGKSTLLKLNTKVIRPTAGLLLPALGKTGTGAVGLAAVVTARAAVTAALVLVGVVAVTRPPVDPSPPTPATFEVATPPAVVTASSRSPVAATPPVAPPRRPRVEPTVDRLAEEVALLDRVHVQLTAGDATAGLALLDEHARRFADGALLDLGEAARVRALCLAGDDAGAAVVAARLVAAHLARRSPSVTANFSMAEMASQCGSKGGKGDHRSRLKIAGLGGCAQSVN